MGLIKKFKEAKEHKRAEKEKQAKFDAQFPPFMRTMTTKESSQRSTAGTCYANFDSSFDVSHYTYYEAQRVAQQDSALYTVRRVTSGTEKVWDGIAYHTDKLASNMTTVTGDNGRVLLTKQDALALLDKCEKAEAGNNKQLWRGARETENYYGRYLPRQPLAPVQKPSL